MRRLDKLSVLGIMLRLKLPKQSCAWFFLDCSAHAHMYIYTQHMFSGESDCKEMLEFGLLIGADKEVWPAEHDYCSWEGVTCHLAVDNGCAGRLKGLQSTSIEGNFESWFREMLNLVEELPCFESIRLSSFSGSHGDALMLLDELPDTIELQMGNSCCGGGYW